MPEETYEYFPSNLSRSGVVESLFEGLLDEERAYVQSSWVAASNRTLSRLQRLKHITILWRRDFESCNQRLLNDYEVTWSSYLAIGTGSTFFQPLSEPGLDDKSPVLVQLALW